jgi:hypothetical protein
MKGYRFFPKYTVIWGGNALRVGFRGFAPETHLFEWPCIMVTKQNGYGRPDEHMGTGEEKMFTREVMGLKEVQLPVEAIFEEAAKDPERPVSVAIVDDHGENVVYGGIGVSGPGGNEDMVKGSLDV